MPLLRTAVADLEYLDEGPRDGTRVILYWLCTGLGHDAFAADPATLLRHAWRTWSPALGLTEALERA